MGNNGNTIHPDGLRAGLSNDTVVHAKRDPAEIEPACRIRLHRLGSYQIVLIHQSHGHRPQNMILPVFYPPLYRPIFLCICPGRAAKKQKKHPSFFQ
jgi:hypothetical protein